MRTWTGGPRRCRGRGRGHSSSAGRSRTPCVVKGEAKGETLCVLGQAVLVDGAGPDVGAPHLQEGRIRGVVQRLLLPDALVLRTTAFWLNARRGGLQNLQECRVRRVTQRLLVPDALVLPECSSFSLTVWI